MQATVYTEYGSPDVLKFEEVTTPTLGGNDVLIRVHAAAVNAGDRHLMRGDPFMIRLTAGLRKPKHQILGADVAGRVTAVGRNVSQFQPGDAVFGDLSDSGFGAFAEYVAAPAHAVVLKPVRMTFEEAAAVPSASMTALQGLRDHGQIQPGQKVLINGASGGVGTFAVQIAKALGAEVTSVCSTRNVDMVRSLGADHVIDYQQESVAEIRARLRPAHFGGVFRRGRRGKGQQRRQTRPVASQNALPLAARTARDCVPAHLRHSKVKRI